MQVPYHRALIYLHGVDTAGLQFSWRCSTIFLVVIAGVGCPNCSDGNCTGNGKNVFDSWRVCSSQSRQGLGSEVFCSGPGWENSV